MIDHIAAMFKLTSKMAAPRLSLLSSNKTVLDVSLPIGTQQSSGSDILLVQQ